MARSPVPTLGAAPGRLRAHELAEAAVLADLAVISLLVARLTPLSGISPVIAAVPIAVLSARRRPRAVAVGGAVLVILTFLLAGFGTAQSALVALLWGAIAGLGFRHGWSRRRQVLWSLAVGWTVVATATLGVLAALAGFRRLALDQARAQAEGIATVLRSAGLDGSADRVVDVADGLIRWWWVAIPSFQFVVSIALALLVRRVAGPALDRIADAPIVDVAGADDLDPGGGDARAPMREPVPVSLRRVTVWRGQRRILDEVDLDVVAGEVTVVIGDNGSGKSTLLALLAGRLEASGGDVVRPGAVGLGRHGGTGWIGQRPETQVVGTRVVDDLAWGLEHPLDPETAAAALDAVGLSGWERRDTTGASGGEQQRIALAAALARRPAMILSDESTAMIDPGGRDLVRTAFRRAADAGAAVVHVTHLDDDLAIADRIVRLDRGRVATTRGDEVVGS